MASAAEDAPGIEDAAVQTKYKTAAEMANRVMAKVVAATVAGAKVLDVCVLGDEAILAETATVYNKKVDGKNVEKGIGFPTCLSRNELVCHNSPLASDPEEVLEEGDLVKIDLGVHIDGYVAPLATTVVVGASGAAPVTGRKADVVLAAYHASEVAMRMCKPGNSTAQITAAINTVAKAFNCTALEGMLMHQVTRNNIAGEKAVIQNPSDAQKKDHKESKFEVNECYAIDVLISTGEGKPRKSERKTSIYKKNTTVYQLKMKTSRAVFSEVSSKFTVFPFPVRMCEDEKKTLLGITECVTHNIIEPYDRLTERAGEFVAQFKALVFITSNGTIKVTANEFDPAVFQSEHKLEDAELLSVLKSSLTAKKKKKKPAAKKAGDADPAAAANE